MGEALLSDGSSESVCPSLVTILWLSPSIFLHLRGKQLGYRAGPLLPHPSRHPSPSPALLLHDFPSLPRLKPGDSGRSAPCGCWPAAGRCQSIRLASRTGRSRRHGSSLGQGGDGQDPSKSPGEKLRRFHSSLTTLLLLLSLCLLSPPGTWKPQDWDSSTLTPPRRETQVGTFVVRGHCCSQPGASEPGG